ncbi:hypothetical protein HDU93_007006, partial [Gonapodya sp. JEL0774]
MEWSKEGCMPDSTLSDNGGELVSKAFEKLHQLHGIKIRHGSPYKPSTQGAIENRNRFFKSRIRKVLKELNIQESTLSLERLQDILPTVNNTIDHEVHGTTSAVPYELFYAKTDRNFYAVPGQDPPPDVAYDPATHSKMMLNAKKHMQKVATRDLA